MLTLAYPENNDTARTNSNKQEGTNVMWLSDAHEGGALKQAPGQEGTRRDGMQMYIHEHQPPPDGTIDGQSHRGCDQ